MVEQNSSSSSSTLSSAALKHTRELLIFGPQALNIDLTILRRLGLQLRQPDNTWLLQALSTLHDSWRTLAGDIPRLGDARAERHLLHLVGALQANVYDEPLLPLPHVLLAPLVVAEQLVQLTQHLKNKHHDALEDNAIFAAAIKDYEVLGLCTGTLSAFATACASSYNELQRHGAAAVQIAMAVGSFVDAYDRENGLSCSLSVVWSDTVPETNLDELLKDYPDAYISVRVDKRRMTVTSGQKITSTLKHRLREVGMHVTDLNLTGRFHWYHHQEAAMSLIQFCDANPQFQLPDAADKLTHVSSESDGKLLINGSLHSIAIRSMLLEKSDWITTYDSLNLIATSASQLKITCFGLEHCVPPTVARKLGPCLEYVCDMDIPDEPGSSDSASCPTPSEGPIPPDCRIAVVGMSCHAPGAKDLDQFWEVLMSGKSQHIEVPGDRFSMETPWRPLDAGRKWYGNFIEDHDKFDHKFFKKNPREAASTDPQQRLALKLAYQAVEHSGCLNQDHNDKHVACYIGVGNNDYERNIACHSPNAYSAKGNLRGFIAGSISHYFGWTGPSMTFDSACSSSTAAIHYACQSILSGDCTAALAGGVNLFTNPDWFHNLAGASFLSPSGQCKPFDADADGYCRGEGGGSVYLKILDRALRDGDQIFGVIAGTHVYQNQNSTAITVPNAPSLSALFGDVLHKAKLRPEDITVVEAHGTGTPVGDPAEYAGIRMALGASARRQKLYLLSVKGSIGHCEFASGILSLLKVLLMMHHGSIPPQASFSRLIPKLQATVEDKIEIPQECIPWTANCRAALINNYGASGSNASMIVTEYPRETKFRHPVGFKAPIRLCGLDDRSLLAYCAKLGRFLKGQISANLDLSIRDLSFQLCRQANHTLPRSLILSAKSSDDLHQQLVTLQQNGDKVKFILQPPARPVILCFGGQISTFVGLDRVIYERITIFQTHLDNCNATCLSLGLESVFPEIFQRSTIDDVVKLQCALFSMQYSCAKSWIDCGVQVAAIVGHSFGELVGLCVAGVYSLRDALRLVSCRAIIVRDSWGKDKGAMLAVEGDKPTIDTLLARARQTLGNQQDPSIACYNSSCSFTLSGNQGAIDLIVELVAEGAKFSHLKMKRLNVTNAFYSALVDPLEQKLKDLGKTITFSDPRIRVQRPVEQCWAPLDERFVFEHMRNPVRFDTAIQRLAKDFPSAIWLEAGSKSTVTIMASRALAEAQSSHFQAVNLTEGGSYDRLVSTTTALWVQGLNVQFWPHHKSQINDYGPLILPPYQFEEHQHWMPLEHPTRLPDNAESQRPDPTRSLTTFLGYQNSDKSLLRFEINTKQERFQELIAATLVVGTACMPSSMLQLEIVLNAFNSLQSDSQTLPLNPEIRDIKHHCTFLIDYRKKLYLDAVKRSGVDLEWDWKISSEDGIEYTSGVIALHVGKLSRHLENFELLQRVVDVERCSEMLNDSDAEEIMQGQSIYRVFEPIVAWGSPYRNVTKLCAKGMQAAALVKKRALDGDQLMDSILSECFCQVASLHVNLIEKTADTVFLCSEIGRWYRAARETPTSEMWKVFVRHTKVAGTSIMSDVFAFDAHSGALQEIILGISYQRMSRTALQKALERAAGKVCSKSIHPSPPMAEQPKDVEYQRPASELRTSDNDHAKHPTQTLLTTPKPSQHPDITNKAREILCNLAGLEPDDIKSDSDLIELGVDSLMAMELAHEVKIALKCALSTEQLMQLTDFQSLVTCIGSVLGFDDTGEHHSTESLSQTAGSGQGDDTSTSDPSSSPGPDTSEGIADVINDHDGSLGDRSTTLPTQLVIKTFEAFKWRTDEFITTGGLANYRSRVIPRSTELCIAYIAQAFQDLGCLVQSASPGQRLQRIPHLAKHRRFVDLLYGMLEHEAQLITFDGDSMVRTDVSLSDKSVDILLAELLADEPLHAAEHKLIALLGPNLADCLCGKQETVQILVSQGRNVLSRMYAESPFTGIWISLLEQMLQQLLSTLELGDQPICILEIGAGTGGTTTKLAEMIASLKGIAVKYTFTDVSGSLVASARKRFKAYPFMEFQVLDIEVEPDEFLINSQHIILSTNCIHATRDLSVSSGNIRKMLRTDGILALVEMTRPLPWVDCVFGLLNGWWLYQDEREYVLASEQHWERVLHSTGFGHVDWSDGELAEADIQRLIVAHASGARCPRTPKAKRSIVSRCSDSLELQAVLDAYIDKYTKGWSVKSRPGPTPPTQVAPVEKCVLLTGATGSLGSHIAASLAQQADINQVICLNRISTLPATTRQHQSLLSRGLKLSPSSLKKLDIIATDSSKP